MKTQKENTMRKLKDEIEILEVEGQGCHDDCYIAGHWVNRSNTVTYGCNWIGPKRTAYNNFFL